MAKARKWLHEKVRGTERTGILVTKESARFKPLAVHILPSGDENAVHWFLEDKADTRSSNYLEDAATEIQVQGLELDYTCLLWDADMRYDNGKWRFYKFNGQTKWVEQTPTTESRQELIKYMLNAYRVLLTRARSGMVICVPEGNGNKTSTGFWEDSTRLPEYYDGTYQYLKGLGIVEIERSLHMASVQDKLQQLFQIVEQLETEYAEYNRKFTIDGHLIGSIGEVLVAEAFDLKLKDTGTPMIDAVTKDGTNRTVQIKATQIDRVSFSSKHENEDVPDQVIVISIDKTGNWKVEFNGPGKLIYENLGKPQKNGQSQISLTKLRRLMDDVPKD